MSHDHSRHEHGSTPSKGIWTSRAFVVFLGFAAMALVLMWEEHRAHILGVLPYLFILACPLMHILMHRDHGGTHGNHSGHDQPQSNSSSAAGKGGPS